MADAKATWTKSPTTDVTGYSLHWNLNGVTYSINVPQDAAGDASGYSSLFSAAAPSRPLANGDQISVSVSAVDPNGASTAVSSSTITISVAPPPPPQPPSGVGITQA